MFIYVLLYIYRARKTTNSSAESDGEVVISSDFQEIDFSCKVRRNRGLVVEQPTCVREVVGSSPTGSKFSLDVSSNNIYTGV